MSENGVPQRLAEFFGWWSAHFLQPLAQAIRHGKMYLG
jgi:hypothetical protein